MEFEKTYTIKCEDMKAEDFNVEVLEKVEKMNKQLTGKKSVSHYTEIMIRENREFGDRTINWDSESLESAILGKDQKKAVEYSFTANPNKSMFGRTQGYEITIGARGAGKTMAKLEKKLDKIFE